MESFERDTVRQLAMLEEQNRAILRTLDEMRGDSSNNQERLRRLEFSNSYRGGIIAVITALGSAFGGCAVFFLQWILSGK